MPSRGNYKRDWDFAPVDEFDGQQITDWLAYRQYNPWLPKSGREDETWAHENEAAWEFVQLPDGLDASTAIATMANSVSTQEARFNPNHEKTSGKFASKTGGISDAQAAGLAKEAAAPDGGFTYDVKTGAHITEGVAVSPYPEHTRIIPASQITGKDIQTYASDKKEMLAKPDHKLGAWNDNGNVSLDVVITVKTPAEAQKFGKAPYNQKAAFNLKTGDTIQLGGSGLASYSDAEERGYFNQVDRSVTKQAKACKKCAANFDPKNVPVHPGCGCDIVTDAVALGMDPMEFEGVQSEFSDAAVQAIGDVPSALMQPELAARFHASDFRFGDLTTWLVSLADDLDLICALFASPEELVAAAGRAVVIENTVKRDISSTSLSVVMFRRNASIEDIAKAYRIINEG